MRTSPVSSVFRFGAFEARFASGELCRDGRRVSIQRLPMEVLRALIERSGDLVTRDELRGCLWPQDTFVDFEHGLNTAMCRLRRALGESGQAPRFIETLAKRGYRFVDRDDTTVQRSVG